ncbi:cell division protein FtsQ/DivIB [Salisaeta longa]|uniref:cell division protein FtsQ/DivIB n=1 Tax=Salisaeta longa TaxID=503170 RepID=UPI0003B59573|nr:FtsQ-type POTRA domain-containing protein [Salisaeta longa]
MKDVLRMLAKVLALLKKLVQAGARLLFGTRQGLIAIAAVAVLSIGLWWWQTSLVVTRIEVVGARYAHPDTLRQMMRLPHRTPLHDVNVAQAARYVEQHPWVRDATVYKQPTDQALELVVRERRPVALVLGPDRTPAFYVDTSGVALPLRPAPVPNVPLLRGVPTDGTPPAVPAPVQRALRALADTGTLALMAELVVRDEGLWGYTQPVAAYGSIPIQVGDPPYRQKMKRLYSFWTQVLQAPPASPTIGYVDLRFNGQVITQARPPR